MNSDEFIIYYKFVVLYINTNKMWKYLLPLTLLVTVYAQSYQYGGKPFSAQKFIFKTQPQVLIVPKVVTQTYAPQSPYIPILRSYQDVREDGTYEYDYATGNGIVAQEKGRPATPEGGTAAQGSYSYTSPEGKFISISYVADENGFRPVGDAIPTPPPIPVAIQRALAYIAAHPAQPESQQGYRFGFPN